MRACATQSYSYDHRDRLISAGSPTNVAYSESYSYDAIGNVLSKTGVGSYSYGANGNGTGAGPHQARTAGGQTYSYDSLGNLISGGGRTFTWTPDNLPATVTSGGVTESYTNDADGERVAKTVAGVTTPADESAGWHDHAR